MPPSPSPRSSLPPLAPAGSPRHRPDPRTTGAGEWGGSVVDRCSAPSSPDPKHERPPPPGPSVGQELEQTTAVKALATEQGGCLLPAPAPASHGGGRCGGGAPASRKGNGVSWIHRTRMEAAASARCLHLREPARPLRIEPRLFLFPCSSQHARNPAPPSFSMLAPPTWLQRTTSTQVATTADLVGDARAGGWIRHGRNHRICGALEEPAAGALVCRP
jgi:hypothetical protein